MNTSALKSFAPAVRRQLMEAVERKLDYVLTAGTPDLRSLGIQVAALRREAERNRKALIERVAYTWFNRLAALRFLDARGWHPFKARVLTPTSPEETQPELMRLLRSGSLPEELRPHTDLRRLNDLLDGRLPTAIPGANPQGEVYRGLILASCRFYHALMPFLFEALDDETELLLPDDLLTATSVAEGFRTEITDEDCAEVEVLGWLYQFYISEKKDAVMARKQALPSEDIPAVTQLFTPQWIVRYLVENSLGRLWLRSRPNSRLKEHMPYYVDDPEGQEPAGGLTVATPEEIKLLDPACGSGHMLVYAFVLLVRIYEEEGYSPSEIWEKILIHNLFGLEICPRAAQLASFALVCKAREQSRAAFRRPVQPQVMCLRDVVLTPEEVKGFTEATGVKFNQDELAQLHQFREHTGTFGSLIQPMLDVDKLAALRAKIGDQAPGGDLLVQNTHRNLRLVLDQAEMLSQRYQVAVANPPYIGIKNYAVELKRFIEKNYKAGKRDTYAAFMIRCSRFVSSKAYVAMITLPNWMFHAKLEPLREFLQLNMAPCSLIDNGRGVFGSDFGSCAFIYQNGGCPSYLGRFQMLFDERGDVQSNVDIERRFKERHYFEKRSSDFDAIPGRPMAYWLCEDALSAFQRHAPVSSVATPKHGMSTSDNEEYLRLWHEVGVNRVGFGFTSRSTASNSGLKWFPFNKGGAYRRWYGNNDFVVNWQNDGSEIRQVSNAKYPYLNGNLDYVLGGQDKFFQPGITWSAVTAGSMSMRFFPEGSLFGSTGQSLFPETNELLFPLLAFLNSKAASELVAAMASTLHFNAGMIADLPWVESVSPAYGVPASECVSLSRNSWDNFETSWDFRDLPLLRPGDWEFEPGQRGGPWKGRTLAESWANYAAYCAAAIRRMQELETENNRLWIDAYDLADELTPEVPEGEITLARAEARRDIAAFLSYAVGCMMGRYSLDKPGLILADAGDTLENYLDKIGKPLDALSFAPDEDAIIPVVEGEWFEDGIVTRTREFLRVTFGDAMLNENLRFLEEALGKPLEKYFLSDFYKDHLQTYKKRPIYWLFQSPKKSFSALVYLHRYTRDTVNTLLNKYLRSYIHKLEARIAHLAQVAAVSTSDREKTAARKEAEKLNKALKDCREWERDTLLPLAQQRLAIDLDDGVKVNYQKFNGALAPIPGLELKEE